MTAQLEMSKPGVFACDDPHPLEREGFSKAESAPGYEVVTDTRGTLLWDKPADGERPLLILTGCQASREYLDYLEGLHISWIACGGDKIDLARACEILKEEFGVQRAAVVGGGHINAAFLADGLLDEVSILVGAGIDGRGGMAAVFDGLPMDPAVHPPEADKRPAVRHRRGVAAVSHGKVNLSLRGRAQPDVMIRLSKKGKLT